MAEPSVRDLHLAYVASLTAAELTGHAVETKETMPGRGNDPLRLADYPTDELEPIVYVAAGADTLPQIGDEP